MRYLQLKYRGKVYTNLNEINEILVSQKFFWLIDSEIENADLEIVNDTIIWNGGKYISGNWFYGIFKNGEFYGTFENGIFENGSFNGKWVSGINLSQDIKNN